MSSIPYLACGTNVKIIVEVDEIAKHRCRLFSLGQFIIEIRLDGIIRISNFWCILLSTLLCCWQLMKFEWHCGFVAPGRTEDMCCCGGWAFLSRELPPGAVTWTFVLTPGARCFQAARVSFPPHFQSFATKHTHKKKNGWIYFQWQVVQFWGICFPWWQMSSLQSPQNWNGRKAHIKKHTAACMVIPVVFWGSCLSLRASKRSLFGKILNYCTFCAVYSSNR